MQVWNVVHAARWKCRIQKIAKNLPYWHHRTTLSGCIFATKACIDNRKKNLLNSNISSTCPRIWWTSTHNGWDRFGSLGHPSNFQRVSRLGSVTAQHSGSGHQPNLAVLNRAHHLYSAGRPSRWALAHILVCIISLSLPFLFPFSLLFFLLTFTYLLHSRIWTRSVSRPEVVGGDWTWV